MPAVHLGKLYATSVVLATSPGYAAYSTNETLTKTMGELEAYKRRISKNARKSMKGKVATSTATAVAVGTPVTDDPTNPDNDVSGNASVNESATDEDPE